MDLEHQNIVVAFRHALIDRLGETLYKTFADSHIAILGLGGLGSHASISLARNGIGKLTLIDFDRVEMSNLNRQQYRLVDLGKYKCHALSEVIVSFNPLIELIAQPIRLTPDNVADYVKDVDLVLECLDEAEAKAWLVRTLRSELPDIPFIAASGMAGIGSANQIHSRKVSDNFYLCGDETSDVAEMGSLICPRVAVCAGHQALTALRLLANVED